MYEQMKYDLFIIHSWKYEDDYNRLLDLLNSNDEFRYVNHSTTPEHNILPTNVMVDDAVLCEKLKEQIAKSQIVIVIAGMYSTSSKWMTFELNTAKSLNKPIIAIKPLHQWMIPDIITQDATKIISWNTDSLFGSMKELLSISSQKEALYT